MKRNSGKTKYPIRPVKIQYDGSSYILIGFKGPFLYKISGKKLRLIFPWNTRWIRLEDNNGFSVSFWGLKGKVTIKSEDINEILHEWNPLADWYTIESPRKPVFTIESLPVKTNTEMTLPEIKIKQGLKEFIQIQKYSAIPELNHFSINIKYKTIEL
jgi:hypothetical protein